MLFVFIWFRSPLTKIADQLPEKVAEANKVTAGGLSFEIEKTAQKTGDPQLATLIGGLSRNAVEMLLRIGKNNAPRPVAFPSTDALLVPPSSEIFAMIELENVLSARIGLHGHHCPRRHSTISRVHAESGP